MALSMSGAGRVEPTSTVDWMLPDPAGGAGSVAGAEWDAAAYDRVSGPQTRWGASVMDRLELEGDELVLDAGCGTGRVTEMLLERWPGIRVVAVDASAAMVEKAGHRLAGYGHRCCVVQGDLLEPLPLSQPVDAVLSTATFHWIPDHRRLFANLAGSMAAGGQLVAQCGGAGNVAGVLAALAQVRGRQARGCFRFSTPEEAAALLRGAGLVDVVAWLQPEPTPFASMEELETFLATVVLRVELAALDPGQRARLVGAVARRLPERTVDYVRLNLLGRRPAGARGS